MAATGPNRIKLDLRTSEGRDQQAGTGILGGKFTRPKLQNYFNSFTFNILNQSKMLEQEIEQINDHEL